MEKISIISILRLRNDLRNCESAIERFSYVIFVEKATLAISPCEVNENVDELETELNSLIELRHNINKNRDMEAESRIFSLQDEYEIHVEITDLLRGKYIAKNIFEQVEILESRISILKAKVKSFQAEETRKREDI